MYEILRNEKYKGIFVYNKTQSRDELTGKRSGHRYKSEEEIIRINGAIPQIISSEDWETVQLILNSRRKAYGNNAKKYIYFLVRLNVGNAVEVMPEDVFLIVVA